MAFGSPDHRPPNGSASEIRIDAAMELCAAGLRKPWLHRMVRRFDRVGAHIRSQFFSKPAMSSSDQRVNHISATAKADSDFASP